MDNTRWQEFNSIVDNTFLNAKEKLLLITIFRFYNPEKGYSYPSKEKLKELCSITQDRDYYKYIKILEEKGLLIKETIQGKGCKFYLTHYQNDSDLQNDSTFQNDSDTHCQNDSQPTYKMTVQKEKKRKIKENIYSVFDSYTENNELITTLKDFAEMRKEIKKPLTTKRAITMLLSKLDKLASTDEEKRLILEQSIFNNWQGVFPLKVENKQVPGLITIEDTVLDMF